MDPEKDDIDNTEDQTQTDTLDDVDAIALREAEQALAAEEGEGESEDDNDGAEAEPAEKADKAEKPAAAAKDTSKDDDTDSQPMIPKARFDEALARERQQNESLSERIARLEGQLQGMSQGRQTEDKAPEPTPEERINSLRQQKRDLAKKFDEGDLTAVQWEEARDELEGQIDEIRATSRQPQQQAQPQSDAYIEDRAAQVAEAHPYMKLLAPSEGGNRLRWNAMQNEAIANLADSGVPLADDARSRLVIYEEMARLSDDYGPRWTGKSPEEVGLKKAEGEVDAASGSDKKPEPQKQSKADARKQKLEAAANHPPDTSDLGKGVGGSDAISDGDIMKMSEKEMEELINRMPEVAARFDPAASSP